MLSQQDYSPFGMGLPERKWGNSYRYGFNGKEKDKEMYGEENAYDFGERIYNPRLGKWLSLDPLQKLIPGITPYNYVYNSPLKYIDPDGKLGIEVHLRKDEKTGMYTIISISINDDIKRKIVTSIKGSSLIETREWRDYMQVTIESSNGNVSSPHIVWGNKRTETDNIFQMLPESWEKAYAKDNVDDGYFEDGGGIMFTTSSGGSLQGTRKTKNSVDVINIDGLSDAMGGQIKSLKLPDVDEQYLFELNKKVVSLVKAFSKKTPFDNLDQSNPNYKKLMGELNTLLKKYNTEVSNNSTTDKNSTKALVKPGTVYYSRSLKANIERDTDSSGQLTDKKATDTLSGKKQ